MQFVQGDRRAHAEAVRAVTRADGVARSRFAAKALSVASLLGMLLAGNTMVGTEQFQLASKVWVALGWTKLMDGTSYDQPVVVTINGVSYRTGMRELAASRYVRQQAGTVAARLVFGGVLGLGLGCAGLVLTDRRRRRKQDELLGDRVIAGTHLVTEAELAKLVATEGGQHQPRLGTVALPSRYETRHMAMIGTTGAGKTTVLRRLLDVVEARGDGALVYDTSGEFIANYYDPTRGDVLLNPFDARSAFWNPFDEITHPADADRLAHYLITPSGDRDRDVWLDTSRILVANMLRALWQENRRTLPDLVNALKTMPREEMERWLANTSSARTFSQDADRATGSVLFMLAKACNLLMFLRASPREGEAGFSCAKFFAGLDAIEGRRPWVFVPRKEDFFDAVKPLMALWLECAASATLGLSPSPKRRVWFLLDEIADLPRVDNLARLLPEGRKFGAAAILTFQAIGQMRGRYGQQAAEAILGCCNTKLFLQLADRESRLWASETIGVSEIEVASETSSLDPKSGEVRKTLGRTRQQRQAVLESELRLEKHRAYLLLPDGLPVAQIGLTDAHIRARGPALQPAYLPIDLSETLWGLTQQSGASDLDVPSQFTTPGPV
jgi:hypothetical protein